MELIYKRSESQDRPVEIDDQSSTSTVYLRRNIQQKTRDPMEEDEETITYYEYQEAVLSKSDYERYCFENKMESMQADIDYISLMSDVEL